MWFKKKKKPVCQAAAVSHCGHVLDHNEDAYLLQEDSGVFLVADGMGGGAFGERASAILATPFTGLETTMPLAEKIKQVSSQLHQRHHQIYRFSEEIKKPVGSTVVVCIIAEEGGALLWCGDSRAYLLQNRRLQQLSEDHRYVLQLLKAGVITEEEMVDHPYANRLTHAVGVSEHLHLQQCELALSGSLRILLCSDGLSGELSDSRLEEIMSVKKTTAQQTCQLLLEQTLQTRARDNVTAVVIDLHLR